MKQHLGTALYLALLLLAAAILSGCASVTSAGHASYLVTRTANGCELSATDGKEFASRNIAFDGKDCTLIVEEGESKAFRGQAIAAKALAVFPVTDLANILAPRDQ